MPKSRHEQMDFAGLEIVADEFIGSFNGDVAVASLASVANLSGTVGTANDTMTAVAAATAATTDTSAASLTSVNTAITAINNNLADLQAKVNAILNALK
jgi:hypothetical protein